MKRKDENILLSEKITESVEWVIISRGGKSLKGYMALLIADILFILFSLYFLVSFSG